MYSLSLVTGSIRAIDAFFSSGDIEKVLTHLVVEKGWDPENIKQGIPDTSYVNTNPTRRLVCSFNFNKESYLFEEIVRAPQVKNQWNNLNKTQKKTPQRPNKIVSLELSDELLALSQKINNELQYYNFLKLPEVSKSVLRLFSSTVNELRDSVSITDEFIKSKETRLKQIINIILKLQSDTGKRIRTHVNIIHDSGRFSIMVYPKWVNSKVAKSDETESAPLAE